MLAAETSDMMNDRVGQTAIVGPYRGKNHLHGFRPRTIPDDSN